MQYKRDYNKKQDQRLWDRGSGSIVIYTHQSIIKNIRGIAQMARALRSGRRGHLFKSGYPDLCYII